MASILMPRMCAPRSRGCAALWVRGTRSRLAPGGVYRVGLLADPVPLYVAARTPGAYGPPFAVRAGASGLRAPDFGRLCGARGVSRSAPALLPAPTGVVDGASRFGAAGVACFWVSRGALPVAEPTPCTKGACGGAATLGAFAPSAESTRRRRVVDTWEFVLDWCVREKVYRVGVIGPAVLCTSLRHAPGPTSRSLIRACAGPRPTSRSRRPLRSLRGSRSASALLRALSPGGCPGRRARRVPSASEHEATREKVCNCRLLGPAAPDHGVPVHGAAAPGARGSVCCVPALLGLLAPDLDAPAGHSSRGAFPLLFLPLWRRHRGMLLVVARGASPVVGPAPYA